MPKINRDNAKKVLAMVGSLLLTGFIFVNSYEIVFNHDVPWFTSIETVDLTSIDEAYPISHNMESTTFDRTQFGDPISLKVSSGKAKVSLIPSIYNNDQWLARPSTGQVTSFSINGFTDNIFIYMRENVRTIQSVREVKAGDNIVIDTTLSFRYVFRVSNVQTISIDAPFVVEQTKKPQIFIVIQDAEAKRNQIVTGNFVVRDQQ